MTQSTSKYTWRICSFPVILSFPSLTLFSLSSLPLKPQCNQGDVWLVSLNNSFQYLNNITCIFTHFFTHTYFQKLQTTLLEQHYQTSPKYLRHRGSTPWIRTICTFFLAKNNVLFDPLSTSIGYVRALASRDAKYIFFLYPQTLIYLFYQLILQLTLNLSFYFYIQPNKII